MTYDGGYGAENGARYKFLKLLPKDMEEEARNRWKKENPKAYEQFIEWEKEMDNVMEK